MIRITMITAAALTPTNKSIVGSKGKSPEVVVVTDSLLRLVQMVPH